MEYRNFEELKSSGRKSKKIIAVAAAHDREVILTVKSAVESGVAEAVLVGDRKKICDYMGAENFVSGNIEIVNEPDEKRAAALASGLVRSGDANVLMKGLVNSSDFLRAVLDKEYGLKTGGLLSHLAVFEVPGFRKLMFHSDGGMNPYPNLDTKIQIVRNAVAGLHRLGMDEPKVAVLAANETVSPNMPATVDADLIAEKSKENLFGRCIAEGPVAMDVALSKEAAAHKQINSRISGETDLFIVPNIDAGNMIGKTLIYCAGAKMAGVILGASHPVVMTSRAENAEGKLNSVILACRLADQ